MTTAFDIMWAVARVAAPFDMGLATGGSTTSLIDTVTLGTSSWQSGKTDDKYNIGTAFIINDAAGAGAAPQGEAARVTDYVATSGTLTLATGDLSATVAAGDLYGITRLRMFDLLMALNAALMDLGAISAAEDDTTLDTIANTHEYTIPAAAKKDLRQVWIASKTAAPYDYTEFHAWRQVMGKATLDLQFYEEPVSQRNIRLVYCIPHAVLTADSSTISDVVPLDYLQWRGAFHIYLQKQNKLGMSDQKWVPLMNQAAEYAAQALAKHPIQLPPRTTRFASQPEPNTQSGAAIKTAEIATA